MIELIDAKLQHSVIVESIEKMFCMALENRYIT